MTHAETPIPGSFAEKQPYFYALVAHNKFYDAMLYAINNEATFEVEQDVLEIISTLAQLVGNQLPEDGLISILAYHALKSVGLADSQNIKS